MVVGGDGEFFVRGTIIRRETRNGVPFVTFRGRGRLVADTRKVFFFDGEAKVVDEGIEAQNPFLTPIDLPHNSPNAHHRRKEWRKEGSAEVHEASTSLARTSMTSRLSGETGESEDPSLFPPIDTTQHSHSDSSLESLDGKKRKNEDEETVERDALEESCVFHFTNDLERVLSDDEIRTHNPPGPSTQLECSTLRNLHGGKNPSEKRVVFKAEDSNRDEYHYSTKKDPERLVSGKDRGSSKQSEDSDSESGWERRKELNSSPSTSDYITAYGATASRSDSSSSEKVKESRKERKVRRKREKRRRRKERDRERREEEKMRREVGRRMEATSSSSTSTERVGTESDTDLDSAYSRRVHWKNPLRESRNISSIDSWARKNAHHSVHGKKGNKTEGSPQNGEPRKSILINPSPTTTDKEKSYKIGSEIIEKRNEQTGERKSSKLHSGKDVELERNMVDSGSRSIDETESGRQGLALPVRQVHRQLRDTPGSPGRVTEQASLFATAVMESLVGELLETAGEAAKVLAEGDGRMDQITLRHIHVAMAEDEEMARFCKDVIIPFQP